MCLNPVIFALKYSGNSGVVVVLWPSCHPSTWASPHSVEFPIKVAPEERQETSSFLFQQQGQNPEKGRKTQTDVRKRHRESLSERLASDSSWEVALGWKLESVFCCFLPNERVWSTVVMWSSQRHKTSLKRKSRWEDFQSSQKGEWFRIHLRSTGARGDEQESRINTATYTRFR